MQMLMENEKNELIYSWHNEEKTGLRRLFLQAPARLKQSMHSLLKKHGHAMLPLPPYSPDFNPIEKTFGVLKRKRNYAPPKMQIGDIIISSDSYFK